MKLRATGLLVWALLASACDLNPQPLPPGEQPDGSVNLGNGGSGSPTGAADSGTAPIPPPGTRGDAGLDAGAAPPPGDGSADGGAAVPSDAASDAPSDAQLDAAEDGGASDAEVDAPSDAGDAAD